MKENITKQILSWDNISEDEPLPDELELLKSWENENTDEYVSFDDIDW